MAAALATLGVALSGCEGDPVGSTTGSTGGAGASGTTSGAGGGGAAGPEPSGGVCPDGPPAEGCVDIRVSTALLSEPSGWAPGGQTLPLGVWGSPEGIHVAWGASKKISGSKSVYVLLVTTYDAKSGTLLSERVFDLLTTPNHGSLRAARGSPSGHIAVIYSEGVERFLAIGHLDDPFPSAVIASVDTPWLPALVTWDGEAFMLDGAHQGEGSYVGRFDTAGNQILPFTKYGGISGPYVTYGPRLSTDPGTGITYLLGATGAPYVAGHLRDGTPLPGTNGVFKIIEPIGTSLEGGLAPSIAAGPEGAWAIWNAHDLKLGLRTIAQRLDLDGDPVGNATELFVSLDVDPGIFMMHASMPRPNGAAWFAGATDMTIFQFEYDGEKMGEPQVLLQHGRTAKSLDALDVRDFYAFEHDGQTWLTFSEALHFVRRVLLAKPGCCYKSGYLLRQEAKQ